MLTVSLAISIATPRNSPETSHRRCQRRFVGAEWQGAKEITHQAGQARPVASAVPLAACYGVGIEKEVLGPLGLLVLIGHVLLCAYDRMKHAHEMIRWQACLTPR